jgi:hypothetical protein
MATGPTEGVGENGRPRPPGAQPATPWWLAAAVAAAGLFLVAATTRSAAVVAPVHGLVPGERAGATGCPRAEAVRRLPPGHPPVPPPVPVPGLPPGHPPVGDRAAPRLPAGHPPVDLGPGAPQFERGFLVDA